ncbi:hypothetical protein [Pseudooceanicola nanhaiensis]|uniref:hypothetical protein n=1 Tax=Pseudooceanicola nanhaiensis TaxID=375761 RepID=UPI001CD55FF4|nr:hypothetical protein [Pseudooceanicola nanhaiensis]MCA0922619.1 hypothetical protein [Pseudooceanicola nanhaiensis]
MALVPGALTAEEAAHAAASPTVTTGDFTAPDRAEPLVMPPAFGLFGFSRDHFLTDRRRLLQRLAAAEPGDASINAILALGDFYVAHAMAPEGRSLLLGLPDRLAPGHAARRAAQLLALDLIDPHFPALTAEARDLLAPDHAAWPDQPLFAALEAVRRGDFTAAGHSLPAAQRRLQGFSSPFREAVLPGLLETAVRTQQWEAARDLAAEFEHHPALRNGPALNYLMGQTAEVDEDYVAAFDLYVTASAGGDLWAHKARVALIDLGLRTETLPLEDARTLLEQARYLWQGDSYAAQLLQELADVQLRLTDRVAALSTLGDLMVRLPDTPEAALASQQSRSLLDAYYADGAAGNLTLASFMAGHQRLAPNFRFAPGFDHASEKYADHFRGLGATSVAAREYELTRDYLAVGQDLGVLDEDPGRLADLELKRAETLFEGGQYELSLALIEQGLSLEDAPRLDRLNTLKARIFAATGKTVEVLQTHVQNPSATYLRIKAEALFAGGDWMQARTTYQQLHDDFPEQTTGADTLNLILATYRTGDLTGTRALAESNPDLAGHPLWSEIAAAMTEAAPDLLPLRSEAVELRVNRATTALDRFDVLNRATN